MSKRILLKRWFSGNENWPVYSSSLEVGNFEGARHCNIVFTEFRDWILFQRIGSLFHTFKYFPVRSILFIPLSSPKPLKCPLPLRSPTKIAYAILEGGGGREAPEEKWNLICQSFSEISAFEKRSLFLALLSFHFNTHFSTLCVNRANFSYCSSHYRWMS